jgi:hypothetical protein
MVPGGSNRQAKPFPNLRGGKARDGDPLGPGRRALGDPNGRTGDLESLRQEANQFGVRCALARRGRDPDLQGFAMRPGDFGSPGVGLDMDGETNPVGVRGKR